MKLATVLATLAAFSGAAASTHGSIIDLLFGKQDLQVVVDSTVTASESEIPRPQPGKPVYYLAVAAGYVSFYSPIAGEKIPDQKVVLKQITKTLESQGYKLATNKNPPTMIIAYAWGTVNGQRIPSMLRGYDSKPDQGRIFEFLGGSKLMRGGTTIDPFSSSGAPVGLQGAMDGAGDFWEMAGDSYYAVKMNAYDIKEASDLKAKLLWSTRMCVSHRGLWMPEAIPLVLSVGAPSIGKHTDKPVLVYASEHYKPSIEIGDLKVVEPEVP